MILFAAKVNSVYGQVKQRLAMMPGRSCVGITFPSASRIDGKYDESRRIEGREAERERRLLAG